MLLYYLSVIKSGYHEGKWCKKYEENKEERDCCYRFQKSAKLCLFGVIMIRIGRQVLIFYYAFFCSAGHLIHLDISQLLLVEENRANL
jgi:hypothetical protein